MNEKHTVTHRNLLQPSTRNQPLASSGWQEMILLTSTGVIHSCSFHTGMWLGYPSDALRKQAIGHYLHPSDHPIFEQICLQAHSGSGVDHFPLRFIHQDSHEICCLCSMEAIPMDEQLTLLALYVSFVSEGNQTASTELIVTDFQLSIDLIPIPMGLTRIDDGLVKMVNKAYSVFSGYSQEEVLGKTTRELQIWVNEVDRERFKQQLEDKGQDGFETAFRQKDGSVSYVIITGQPVVYQDEECVLVQFVDITARKLAEQSLQKSEAHYRRLAENLPDISIVFVNKELEITFVSGGEIVRKGNRADAFRGVRIAEIIDKKYEANFIASIYDAFEGRSVRSEVEYNHQIYSYYASPIVNHDGGVDEVQLILTNITERLADDKLRQQWADAFFHCGQGIAFGDPVSNTILTCNPAYAELQGYDMDEIPGMPVSAMYSEDMKEQLMGFIRTADEKGHIHYETQMKRKDCSIYPVRVDLVTVKNTCGRVIYRIATIQDISEQTQLEKRKLMAEKNLTESEKRFSAIFQYSPIGISLVHLATDRQVSVNPAVYEIFGYEPSEVLQRKAIDLNIYLHPDDRADFQNEFRAKGRVVEREMRVRRKSGEEIYVAASIESVEIEGEAYALVMTRNINKQKQAEQAKYAIEQRLKIFVEHAPAAIAMFDREMKYIAVSKRYMSVFWLEDEDIVGKIHYEVFPKMTDYHRNIHQRCLAGASEKCDEVQLVRRDGSIDWLKWEIHPWYDVDGTIGGILFFSELITEQKLAAERIRHSEENYRYLFERNPHPMWVYDQNSLRILAINKAATNLYGYSREEFLGMTIRQLRTVEDQARFDSYINVSMDEYDYSGEWRHLKKDGQYVDVEVFSHALNYFGQPSRLAVGHDITIRKKALKALKESEENFREIADTIEDVLWLSDSQTNKVYYASPAYEKIWERDVQALYDSDDSIRSSVHPDDMIYYEQAQRCQQMGISFASRYRIVTPGGGVKNILDRGFPVFDEQQNLVHYVGVAKDESERILYIDEIKKLSAAVEQSPVSVFITDLSLRIEYVNDTLVNFMGYSRDELIGQTPQLFSSGLDDEHAFSTLTETTKQGSVWKGVLINRKKNGELCWENTSITPLTDDKGHLKSFLCVKIDVTHEKLAEQKMLQLNDELEQKVVQRTRQLSDTNEKLNTSNATKDKFFSIIAHDLKNPFNTILSFSQLINNDIDQIPIDKLRKNIGFIYDSANSAYKLLENLLVWARSQTGAIEFNPQRVTLKSLFDIAKTSVFLMAGQKQINLTISEPDSTVVFADVNMLTTVLRNLLTNAIKFTNTGGLVWLDFNVTDQMCEIRISDTGVGMEADKLTKLFRINERVSTKGTNNEQGTGLGLILCKEFTETNGGTIRVESTPGKGSTFSITIPLAE